RRDDKAKNVNDVFLKLMSDASEFNNKWKSSKYKNSDLGRNLQFHEEGQSLLKRFDDFIRLELKKNDSIFTVLDREKNNFINNMMNTLAEAKAPAGFSEKKVQRDFLGNTINKKQEEMNNRKSDTDTKMQSRDDKPKPGDR